MDYAERNFINHELGSGRFEGWYFKQRRGDHVYCLIPGISAGSQGEKAAFIQCIWSGGSAYLKYPFSEFSVSADRRSFSIAKNHFSLYGISLDIDRPEMTVKGNLRFQNRKALKSSVYAPGIMGPFSYLKSMQCNHGLLSLHHETYGRLFWNEDKIEFTGEHGYIEKDWGKSFPEWWIWFECHEFSHHPKATVMLSIAKIPFLRRHFTGVLCVLDNGNRQTVLASYYGAALKSVTNEQDGTRIIIRQGKYTMIIKVFDAPSFALLAPINGAMTRKIIETPSCKCEVIILYRNRILWEDTGRFAGFEKTAEQ